MAETEFVTVNQAAELLGTKEKAVRAAIGRDAFPGLRKEPHGKTVRISIPRSDVEAYDKRRRRRTSRPAPASLTETRQVAPFRDERIWGKEPALPDPVPEPVPDWQQAAQRLQRENLELRARIIDLEQRLGVPPGA